MFEIGIFSVIVLAISYWAVLWVMGRREDVLHGEFVKKGEPPTQAKADEAGRPNFPARPVQARLPERTVEAAPAQPAFRQERLDSLLNTIKQDLNQLVQK
ncbi:MAG: hypothetical protein PS018_19000 [bacterium]|nr:hypothetical protein [bacterium]